MQRRHFLTLVGLAPLLSLNSRLAFAAPLSSVKPTAYQRLLVLLELKGGNDGLNTVIPYADDRYYALRPRLAIARDQVLPLDERTGLHPSLTDLLAFWRDRELAIVQGVGYADPNLSHFRSGEIWETASASSQYLDDGWLTRLFAAQPAPPTFLADGVVVGSQELGPLRGHSRTVMLGRDPRALQRNARMADDPQRPAKNPALAHILKVEGDIRHAASHLNLTTPLKTPFPQTPFGNDLKTAAQVIAGNQGPAVIKVTLNGFDTHRGQADMQARLLKELATGLTAFKAALVELNRWDSTLLMTYAEFGRRPQENMSNGTDHGTANVHFLLGGRVKGGLYGKPPRLNELQNDNLVYGVDFRDLYATAIEQWWGLSRGDVLGGWFRPLPVLKA